jgi:hypothetical protein
MINIKKFIDAAIASGAIKPTDPAATPAPSGDLSSGNFLKSIAKVVEAVPNAKSASSEVGGMYKRLTAADIEEENKKKMGMKKGGQVKSSASKRADGCAQRGKTRGKMV